MCITIFIFENLLVQNYGNFFKLLNNKIGTTNFLSVWPLAPGEKGVMVCYTTMGIWPTRKIGKKNIIRSFSFISKIHKSHDNNYIRLPKMQTEIMFFWNHR